MSSAHGHLNPSPTAAQGSAPRAVGCARWLPVLALTLLLPGPARALDGELQLTLGPGYASLPELGDGLDGVGAGGEVNYHLSSFWSLSAGGFFSHHFSRELDDDRRIESTEVTSFWLGPRFNLDVLVVIPFLALGPEILLTRGALHQGQDHLELALRAALGFDYRPTRRWSLGLEVTWHAHLRDPLDYPRYLTTVFRFSFHHDLGGL